MVCAQENNLYNKEVISECVDNSLEASVSVFDTFYQQCLAKLRIVPVLYSINSQELNLCYIFFSSELKFIYIFRLEDVKSIKKMRQHRLTKEDFLKCFDPWKTCWRKVC